MNIEQQKTWTYAQVADNAASASATAGKASVYHVNLILMDKLFGNAERKKIISNALENDFKKKTGRFNSADKTAINGIYTMLIENGQITDFIGAEKTPVTVTLQELKAIYQGDKPYTLPFSVTNAYKRIKAANKTPKAEKTEANELVEAYLEASGLTQKQFDALPQEMQNEALQEMRLTQAAAQEKAMMENMGPWLDEAEKTIRQLHRIDSKQVETWIAKLHADLKKAETAKAAEAA